MNFRKKIEENDLQYIYRICSMKDSIGTWTQVASIINENLGTNYDESCYRKKYKSYIDINNNIDNHMQNDIDKEHIDLLQIKQDELYKQQVKTRDVLREYRSSLRDEARIENLIEAIRADTLKYEPNFRPYTGEIFQDGSSAILCIGDWHCGDRVHNFYNDFDLEILEARIEELCDKTIKYCQRNNVSVLNVINLGDLFNSQLHVTSRVENEMDTIQQIKIVVRLVCSLLIKLAENIEQITYRSVLDNHSRINMNYKEHIEKESFAKLIDWWLEDKISAYNEKYEARYKNPILMKFDNIDDNIGLIKINDKNIFFSHGHLGSQNTITQDLTFATGIIADIVLLGHWHTDKKKNYQGKKVYFNGSVKGVDSYALNKRLFDKPSQLLLIFEKEDTIEIPIQL